MQRPKKIFDANTIKSINILWVSIFFSFLLWSAYKPKDYFTWILEVTPALIAFPILVYTYNSFRLTALVYSLILLHCIVLMIGGHYTYAEVPLFDWIRDQGFGTRNNYDKIGHFMQGFVPFAVAREIVVRKHIINGRFWQAFFCISLCLAISACYELIEWLVAITSGQSAEAFLGTQGDVWDTQGDMAMAFIGAIACCLLFSKLQDQQIKALAKHKP